MTTVTTYPYERTLVRGIVILGIVALILTQVGYQWLNLYAGTLGGIYLFMNAAYWDFYEKRQQVAFRIAGVALLLIAWLAWMQILIDFFN